MACCSLLHPLRWEYILIPIVPNVLKDLLDAPLPFIAGVNKSTDERWHIAESSSSSLVVLLDSGELVQSEQLAMSKLPPLGNLRATIEGAYKTFQKTGKKELRYSPGEAEMKAVGQIMTAVEDTLKKFVFSKLPSCESIGDGMIELETIKGKVKAPEEQLGEDQDFVERLLDTQMFASYVQEHYEYFLK